MDPSIIYLMMNFNEIFIEIFDFISNLILLFFDILIQVRIYIYLIINNSAK